MAAIYSGIHLKLKNPRTPWPDKLKLARFAWISTQCLLPNKEQLLLDWTSHALSGFYNKKVEVPLEVVEGLWSYLDDILHSRKLRNHLSQGKTISLRITVAQMINERISEYSSRLSSTNFHTVLNCCSGILTSPVLSVTYTANYELLVELLVRLCALSNLQLREQKSEEPLSLKVFEVLVLVLNTYLTVQKQQANSNRVFSQVTAKLLQPLFLLRHLLNTRVWTEKDDVKIRQNLSKEIRSKVDTLLQLSLFISDNLQSYREEVLPSQDKAGAKKSHVSKGLLGPVKTILSKLCVQGDGDEEQAVFYAAKANSLPLLFKFALDSFCKGGENKLVGFHFMTKLVTALGFTVELDIEKTFSASNWGLALLALENFLNSCLSADIYNVAVDKIQHQEVQFNFYRKLARLLFNNTQLSIPAWYRCLKCLLTLNHYILEPDLDELLSTVWVDAENAEVRVRKASEALLSFVLQTYAKLRQLPKLFEELLDVICRPAADELRPALLSEAIQKTLSPCLLDTPPSQILEICFSILKRIQSYPPSCIQQKGDLGLKVFSMSLLLNAVLFNFKTLDNSTPVPTVKQTQNLMEQMLAVVTESLEQFEKNLTTAGQIHDVVLLLTHTWVELDTLFKMYCCKYTSQNITTSLVDRALALESKVDQVSPLGKLLQKLLALHKLKLNLLKSTNVSDEDLANRKLLSQFIVSRQELSVIPNDDQIWDLQLCNVTSAAYMPACWFLIASNLPLLSPYFKQKDASDLAEFMLKSLRESFRVSGNNLENTGVSVSLISRQLLESQVLCELPEMYSALIKCIVKEVFELVDPSRVESVSPSFLKPCTETSMEVKDGETSMRPSLMRLKGIGQEILKARSSLPLSKTQIDSFLSLLKVAHNLNGDAMTPEDYSELFLSLFMVTVCFQCDERVDLAEAIELLKKLFSVMSTLLVFTNSSTILKIIRGSSLLEATMTFLCTRCSEAFFRGVDGPTWISLLQSVQNFIQSLIHLIIDRKSSMCINLQKFTSFMVKSYRAAGESNEKICSLQLHLVTFCTLCKELISTLGKSKQLDETLIHMLEMAISVMEPAIQIVLTGKESDLLRQSFSVEVVTVMLKSELTSVCHLVENSSEEDGLVKISHMSFYKSFFQQILKELCPLPRPMDFLVSSIGYLCAFYTAAKKVKAEDLGEIHAEILRSIYGLLSGSWLSISEVKKLEGAIKELFDELLNDCKEQQFHVLLLMLKDGLVASKIEEGHHTKVLSAVTITKLLSCCLLPKHCSNAFWLITPQILSTLIFVIKESSKQPLLTSALTIPTLEALTVLLRQGSTKLSNPHDALIVLGALQFVPLDSHSTEEYLAAFGAIHEVLFAFVLCYPQVTLNAFPVFLNCFYRLVSSVMHEGRQKGETDRGCEKDRENLLKCAMLVERMYNHIGGVAEETFLSSLIVAQYVSTLQRVTLQPEIKSHLTEGIYCILDCCVEKDIKFLNTTLHMGVKEVFNELYSNFTHYHKSQRQGEEKYTV